MPTTVSLSVNFQQALRKLTRIYPSAAGEVRKLIIQLEHDAVC